MPTQEVETPRMDLETIQACYAELRCQNKIKAINKRCWRRSYEADGDYWCFCPAVAFAVARLGAPMSPIRDEPTAMDMCNEHFGEEYVDGFLSAVDSESPAPRLVQPLTRWGQGVEDGTQVRTKMKLLDGRLL